MSDLKKEWLEKMQDLNKRNVFIPGHPYAITVSTDFYNAPEEIKKDKDVVWAALTQSHESLILIDTSFLANKQFILDLIASDYPHNIYDYLGKTLKEDSDIFKLCVMRDKSLSKYQSLPEKIRTNRELILFASKHVDIYDHIESINKHYKIPYHLDSEILYNNINKFPKNFLKLMKRIKKQFYKDIPLMLKVIEACGHYTAFQNSHIYIDFPAAVKINEDISIAYLKNHGQAQHVPTKLINSEDFNIRLITETHFLLKDLPSHFQDNDKVVRAAVQYKGSNLEFASERLKNNPELAELALKTTNNINILGKELLQNKEIVMKFIEADPFNYLCIKYPLDQDIDIGKMIMKNKTSLYRKLHISLKTNLEVIQVFLENGGHTDVHLIESAFNDLLYLPEHNIIDKIKQQAKSIGLSKKLENTLDKKEPQKKSLKI